MRRGKNGGPIGGLAIPLDLIQSKGHQHLVGNARLTIEKAKDEIADDDPRNKVGEEEHIQFLILSNFRIYKFFQIILMQEERSLSVFFTVNFRIFASSPFGGG